ncbi:MAG: DUF5658 family protein [Phycisphaerae bacterium]|nr:hypothetical protein [Phycisphaerae bacterium]MCZ2398904.1 DUF5658 family protein [Phycisphaerae bacterium]NUQ50395.1 hypothetical protein [Phycisphaerae bacterium]
MIRPEGPCAIQSLRAARRIAPDRLDALIAGLRASAIASEGSPTAAVVRPAPSTIRPLVLFGWPTRARRVVLLLALTWALNLFDLGSTLSESRRHFFEELNPVASAILHLPAYVLVSYKAGLVLIGSVILLWLRRRHVAEMAAWLVFSAYVGVTLRWAAYYTHLLDTLQDPAINVCPVTGELRW